jgi:hypothetical protein
VAEYREIASQPNRKCREKSLVRRPGKTRTSAAWEHGKNAKHPRTNATISTDSRIVLGRCMQLILIMWIEEIPVGIPFKMYRKLIASNPCKESRADHKCIESSPEIESMGANNSTPPYAIKFIRKSFNFDRFLSIS